VPTVSFSIISASIGDVMFIYLTPLIPLSFKGEGEVNFEGGKPLQSTPGEGEL
jgi:hypothetical protein